MTYKQTYDYYEDEAGDVVISLFLSDTKAGLFSETFTEMSIINLSELKESVEIASGQLAEDEVTFTMSDIFADTTDNISAREFLLEGLSASVKRFIGIFIHYADETPSESNFAFYGVLVPDAKANDLYWNSAKYATDPNPFRDWSFTARPLTTQLLDNVLVKDCIDAISESFWTTNAIDRDGYYNDGTIKSRFSELINLNLVIKEVCTKAVAELASQSLGTYTIACPVVNTNVSFRPSRYINRADYFVSEADPTPPLININFLNGAEGNAFADSLRLLGLLPRFNSKVKKKYFLQDEVDLFPIDDTDVRPLVIGFDTIDDDNSPYVSQRVFRTQYLNTVPDPDAPENLPNEYNSESAKSTLCYKDETTVTDWLYQIAFNFGFFLRLDYEENGDILVLNFAPRISANTQTYLPYVTGADLQTNLETQITSKDTAVGKGFYWTTEGQNIYKDKITDPAQKQTSGKNIYFTISPNYCGIYNLVYWNASNSEELFGVNKGFPIGSALLPHNMKFINIVSSLAHPDYKDTTSAHTGIYMKVSKYDAGNDLEATSYFTTAGQVTLLQNGTYKDFSSMASYINGLVAFDEDYYKTTYSITLPYLMSFSINSDGSDKFFKALNLLNNVVIDGVTYKIVDITRNFAEISTKISLHNASRFDFSTTIPELEAIAGGTIDLDGASSLTSSIVSSNVNIYAVSGNVAQFNVVEIFDNSGELFIRNANPYQSSYPFKFAFALATGSEPIDTADRFFVPVAFDNEIIEISWLGSIGSVGEKLYMQYGDGILQPNFTNDLPSYTPEDLPIGELPLWVEVGTIIEPTKLQIKFNKYLLEAI